MGSRLAVHNIICMFIRGSFRKSVNKGAGNKNQDIQVTITIVLFTMLVLNLDPGKRDLKDVEIEIIILLVFHMNKKVILLLNKANKFKNNPPRSQYSFANNEEGPADLQCEIYVYIRVSDTQLTPPTSNAEWNSMLAVSLKSVNNLCIVELSSLYKQIHIIHW